MVTIVVNGVEKVYSDEEYSNLLKDSTIRVVESSDGKKKLLEKMNG